MGVDKELGLSPAAIGTIVVTVKALSNSSPDLESGIEQAPGKPAPATGSAQDDDESGGGILIIIIVVVVSVVVLGGAILAYFFAIRRKRNLQSLMKGRADQQGGPITIGAPISHLCRNQGESEAGVSGQ